MKRAKVFNYGNSQAVRLPKEFQLRSKEVGIFRRDGQLILREIPKNLAMAFTLLSKFPDDFFSEGRNNGPQGMQKIDPNEKFRK